MPEHTPNKQSKIDFSVTDTVISPPFAMSVSDNILDENDENYSVNLKEYCNTSQFPDSGFENSCSVSASQNLLSTCQSSEIAHTNGSNQQGSSGYPLQTSETNSTSCIDMFSQRFSTNFKESTAFQSFQDICSSSKYNSSWNILPPSVNSYWNSRQSGVQNQQSDQSFDTGYSTGSSIPGQDSQMERSYMDQGSQLDLETDDNVSTSGNGFVKDNYLYGENELEDLLYHFQNFFQNRFESEVQHFREVMNGILQEQQSHVRQIVHTAIREQSSSQRSYNEEFLSEESEKSSSFMKPANQTGTGMTINSVLDTDYYIPTSICLQSNSSIKVVKDGATRNKLLDLYSLSCSVSTLLAKSQFKS